MHPCTHEVLHPAYTLPPIQSTSMGKCRSSLLNSILVGLLNCAIWICRIDTNTKSLTRAHAGIENRLSRCIVRHTRSRFLPVATRLVVLHILTTGVIDSFLGDARVVGKLEVRQAGVSNGVGIVEILRIKRNMEKTNWWNIRSVVGIKTGVGR